MLGRAERRGYESRSRSSVYTVSSSPIRSPWPATARAPLCDSIEANASCEHRSRTDDQGLTKQVQGSRRLQIMTELTFEPPIIRPFGTPPSSQAPEAPGGGRVDAINVTRHVGARQILQKLSLSIETRRVGRHRRRQWSRKDHIAGDPCGTATTVCRGGSARRRRSRCPSRRGFPHRLRAARRHHPPRDAPAPHAALCGAATAARGHIGRRGGPGGRGDHA